MVKARDTRGILTGPATNDRQEDLERLVCPGL